MGGATTSYTSNLSRTKMILFDVIKILGLLPYYIYANIIIGIYLYCVEKKYKYYSLKDIWNNENAPLKYWGFIILMLICLSTYFV